MREPFGDREKAERAEDGEPADPEPEEEEEERCQRHGNRPPCPRCLADEYGIWVWNSIG